MPVQRILHTWIASLAILAALMTALPVRATEAKRYLVKVHPSVGRPLAYVEQRIAAFGATAAYLLDAESRRHSPLASVLTVEVPANHARDLRAALTKDARILYVAPDAPVEAFFVPNDPSYTAQWNLPAIGVPEAWDLDAVPPLYGGDPSVIVAVLDTGAAYENLVTGGKSFTQAPDLATTSFAAGYDFVNDDAHPNDDNGHGTHVAGTIVENTDNGVAGSGIAFHSTLMPIKVLDAQGNGSISTVARAIDYAVQNKADVINLSLGTATPNLALEDAVKRALAANVVLVAAAGNEANDALAYPAAYDGVIAVTAVGKTNELASYSNFGTGASIAAPGGDANDFIWQQTFSNLDSNRLPLDYATFGVIGYQGTSQAAPQVAAAAALLLAQGVAPANIQSLLENTATDLGEAGYDTKYGNGLLNVHAALAAYASDTVAPTTTYSTSPTGPDGDVGYFRTKPDITLRATDDTAGSGVKAIYYHWDSAAFAEYAAPLPAPEGQHTLTYYAEDNAGNKESEQTVVLTTDTVAPVIDHLVVRQDGTKATVTLRGRVVDATSGVASLTIDGTAVMPNADGEFVAVVTGLPFGRHKFVLTTVDTAGIKTTVKKLVRVARPETTISAVAARGGPQVLVHAATGKAQSSFFAYPKSFTGGLTVAAGDLNGDGTEEIVTAPGPGSARNVRVFNSANVRIGQFAPYGKDFANGVHVTTGDVDGDGTDEIITGPGTGGGPIVGVFTATGNVLRRFSAYAKDFRGGIAVTTGDVDGDGTDEIITGPLQQATSEVRIVTLQGKIVQRFFAYPKSFTGGLTVAAGDLNGDGTEEIVTAPGPGSARNVRVFNSANVRIGQFAPYGKDFANGVHVTTGDVDGDGTDEIITGPGTGGGPQVRVFDGDFRLIAQYFVLPKQFHGGLQVSAAYR